MSLLKRRCIDCVWNVQIKSKERGVLGKREENEVEKKSKSKYITWNLHGYDVVGVCKTLPIRKAVCNFREVIITLLARIRGYKVILKDKVWK